MLYFSIIQAGPEGGSVLFPPVLTDGYRLRSSIMRFIKKFIITLIVILLLGAGAAGGRLLWQGYQIYQEVIDGGASFG